MPRAAAPVNWIRAGPLPKEKEGAESLRELTCEPSVERVAERAKPVLDPSEKAPADELLSIWERRLDSILETRNKEAPRSTSRTFVTCV